MNVSHVMFMNFILNSKELVDQPVNPFISTIARTIGIENIVGCIFLSLWSTSNINPLADCKEITNGINNKTLIVFCKSNLFYIDSSSDGDINLGVKRADGDLLWNTLFPNFSPNLVQLQIIYKFLFMVVEYI